MEALLQQILEELKTMNAKLDRQYEFASKTYSENMAKSGDMKDALAAVRSMLPPHMREMFDGIKFPAAKG